MKRISYFLAIAAMILGAVACQKETGIEAGKNGNVTFTVTLPGIETKAISDGLSATKLNFAIYDGEGNYLQELSESATVSEFSGKKATVTVQVIQDLTYQFVFFAEAPGNTTYTFAPAEKKLSVNYSTANLEAVDAFYAATDKILVTGPLQKSVTLYRPLAQINVGSTVSDLAAAKLSKIDVKGIQSSYVLTDIYSELDLLTGELTGTPADVTLALASKPEPAAADDDALILTVNGKDYGWIAMAYVLAGEKELTDVTLEVKTKNTATNADIELTRDIANVPVQRNHRTNILGNIFSQTATFNIEIDSDFEEPDYKVVIPEWSGETNPDLDITTDPIIITTGEDLAQIAALVNSGNSLEGKTVKLAADINLGNKPWTPIGKPQEDSYSNYFKGDFDGDGYTIYNLNVNANKTVGLFGRLHRSHTIKNVNIDGFELNTNHFAGAIVGWVEGNSNVIIENCSVKNGKITVKAENTGSEWDNGDKAGAIAGFFYKSQMINCSAEDVTISAYRDFGGLVGYSDNSTITGNSVKNITLIQDNSQDYKAYTDFEKYNVREIVGRIAAAGTISDNTFENVTIVRQIVDGVIANADGSYTLTSDSPYSLAEVLGEVLDNNKTVTINIDAGTYDNGLVFSGNSSPWNGRHSNSTINIVGATGNPEDVILDGQVFSSSTTVNFKNVTLTNKNAKGLNYYKTAYGSNGGGFQSQKCIIMTWTEASIGIENCILDNQVNDATSIYTYWGTGTMTVNVKDSKFTGYQYNRPVQIYGKTHATFENCSFENIYRYVACIHGGENVILWKNNTVSNLNPSKTCYAIEYGTSASAYWDSEDGTPDSITVEGGEYPSEGFIPYYKVVNGYRNEPTLSGTMPDGSAAHWQE